MAHRSRWTERICGLFAGNFLSTQSKPDQLIGAILTLELEQTTEPDGGPLRGARPEAPCDRDPL